MDDLVLVGRVARAHGNRGQVIVNLDTDFPDERFRVGAVVMVGPSGTARAIREVRFHQGRPIIALEGIETMNEAEALAGAELKVPAAAAGTLPEDTYYHYDLVGCAVVTADGTAVGTVKSVDGEGQVRLVIAAARGDVLVPFTQAFCEVDVAARRIVVRPPEGLLDVNGPWRE